MSAAPQPKPQPAPKAAAPQKRYYYVIDDQQSAELEQMTFVLTGLAELSWNALSADNEGVFMTRCHISAIFEHLGTSLRKTLNEDRGLPVVWVEPTEVKSR